MSSENSTVSKKVSKQTCAYCLWEFTQAETPLIQKCESCDTPYHQECFAENEGCTVFGCPAWTARQLGVPLSQVPGAMAPRPTTQTQEVAQSSQLQSNVIDTTFCGSCGAAVAFDAKFCTKCGAPAPPPVAKPSFCTECGEGLAMNAKFCVGCGHPVKVVI